jgi:hypothetical protein
VRGLRGLDQSGLSRASGVNTLGAMYSSVSPILIRIYSVKFPSRTLRQRRQPATATPSIQDSSTWSNQIAMTLDSEIAPRSHLEIRPCRSICMQIAPRGEIAPATFRPSKQHRSFFSRIHFTALDWSHPLHSLEWNPTLALSTALAALVAPLGSCQTGAAHSPVGSGGASW